MWCIGHVISRKFPFLSASDPRHNKKALKNTVFSFVLNFGGGVLERFLPTNQHTQRKLLNFENWCSGGVSKSANI